MSSEPDCARLKLSSARSRALVCSASLRRRARRACKRIREVCDTPRNTQKHTRARGARTHMHTCVCMYMYYCYYAVMGGPAAAVYIYIYIQGEPAAARSRRGAAPGASRRGTRRPATDRCRLEHRRPQARPHTAATACSAYGCRLAPTRLQPTGPTATAEGSLPVSIPNPVRTGSQGPLTGPWVARALASRLACAPPSALLRVGGAVGPVSAGSSARPARGAWARGRV